DPAAAEPLALILEAVRAADADAGVGALAMVDSLELMPVGCWPYDDLAGLVAARLGLDVAAARRRVHTPGGEMPIRVLDAVAARIAAGDARMVLLAGAEGTRAVTRARTAGVDVPWTPPGTRPVMPTLGPDLQRAAV